MKTTKETLLQRLRDPDDGLAWEEFYQLYSGLIYHYAHQRGLNDTDAMEIVSECLAHLSRQMKEFLYDRSVCKFRSYLRTIVNNKVVDHLRKKRPEQADDVMLANMKSGELDPDTLWDQEWQINHMMHCWQRIEKEIPPIQAEAFQLYVIEEMPIKDVSEKLGLSTDNIYQIKTRLVRRLKDAMKDLIGDE